MSEYVLLGFADAMAECKHTSWTTNKIGGKPDWMNQHRGVPLCFQCQTCLSLVIQIYCPMDNSQFHRTIYVFCCSNKKCWTFSKSWSVQRMQSLEGKKHSKDFEQKQEKIFDKWGNDDDDWNECDDAFQWNIGAHASSQVSHSQISYSTSQFEALRLDDQAVSQKYIDAESYMFNSYYVNVFNESDCQTTSDDSGHIKKLVDEYKKNNENESSSACSFNIGGKENYEKNETKDRAFYKFWKTIRKSSSQIVRYSWGGSPLLFTKKPDTSLIPKCTYCGAERKFEFQLMPGLIPYLKLKEKENEQIEFGTVLIYTCSKNCWKDRKEPQDEYIAYYPDPDLKYFKSHNR